MNKFPCEPRHLFNRNTLYGKTKVELCCTMHGKLGEVEVFEHLVATDTPERQAAKDKLREIWQNHVSPKTEPELTALPTHLL